MLNFSLLRRCRFPSKRLPIVDSYLRIRILGVGILLLLLTAMHTTHAFDGNREGFYLGGNLGPAVAKIASSSEAALLTDFEIGCGLSQHLLVGYSGLQIWRFTNTGSRAALMPAIGMRYYFSPNSRSFLVRGGIGIVFPSHDISNLILGRRKGRYLIHSGCGYEFTRHAAIEIVAGYSDVELNYETGASDFWFVAVTVSLLAF